MHVHAYADAQMQVFHHAEKAMCFLLHCYLEEKPLWEIAKSASNGNKNSQSNQLYPITLRDLDSLQKDENIRYIFQLPIVSTKGETSGV